ncbi:MAG: aldose 1-epimerase family protein [Micromonosporaceae bacterium]
MKTTPTVYTAPSGTQWHIAAAGHRAVVVELGGGLRRYDVAGVSVVDGYTEDELCPGAAGQVLAPWPNRIRDGRYRFNGVAYQLPLTEPTRHNAIHGLVQWLPWSRVAGSADSVTVECVLPAQPGYPWPLRLRTTWSVGADGLRAVHEATNLAGTSAPFGFGVHPYLRLPGVRVDDTVLHLPARRRLLLDARLLPVGVARVDGGRYDFTTPRRIGAVALDSAYGGLSYDEAGRSRVTLSTSDGSRRVTVWADRSFQWWQLYTGDTLPPERARRSIAVEPMTCPPDAFRSGRDLVVLAPGETWQGAWGIRPEFGERA